MLVTHATCCPSIKASNLKIQHIGYEDGIASAPAIWQRTIDQILKGIPGTQCYLDDIIITGTDTADHMRNLKAVFNRLQSYGLRLNRNKCEFLKAEVKYCGHIINAAGLCMSPEKTAAVVNSPVPQNVSELRTWLGFVSYYRKFLPNLSSLVNPLNKLLKKDAPWKWGKEQQSAVRKVKELIVSERVLVHFDPAQEIVVSCDASSYGLGCVLSHIINGEERPVAFASRTLIDAEKRYPQIEKEALGIVWGIWKFQYYLEGHRFTLITDHRPLTTIFSPAKSVPVTAAARMQRWAMFLSGFQYQIKYRNTKDHGNADTLSRLPLPATKEDLDHIDPVSLLQMSQIESVPLGVADLRRYTQRDPVLSQVFRAVSDGFPYNLDK